MNKPNCPFCGSRPRTRITQENQTMLRCKISECSAGQGWVDVAAWNRRFVCYDKNDKAVYAGNDVGYKPVGWKKFIICQVVEMRPPRYGYGLVGANDFTEEVFFPSDIELIESGEDNG